MSIEVENKPIRLDCLIAALEESGLRKISLSWIQRRFRVGFNMASDIKDKMQEWGLIDDDGYVKVSKG